MNDRKTARSEFADTQGDSTGGMIPYKNPPALIAYYLGIFSLFPLIGLPIGIAAFVLGIMGLKKRKQRPHVKGSVHAWIGIIAGGGMALFWALVILLIVVAAMSARV